MEIEKGLAGHNASGDNGVGARLFGTFLTWMNDHTTDVYVVASANNISSLPPELTRAGRFDAIFYFDLPGRKEKDMIWEIYRVKFHVDEKDEQPSDTDWTGAEIEACCRTAILQGKSLKAAATSIVPVAVANAEATAASRKNASGRYLSASYDGVFMADNKTGGKLEYGSSHSLTGRKLSKIKS